MIAGPLTELHLHSGCPYRFREAGHLAGELSLAGLKCGDYLLVSHESVLWMTTPLDGRFNTG